MRAPRAGSLARTSEAALDHSRSVDFWPGRIVRPGRPFPRSTRNVTAGGGPGAGGPGAGGPRLAAGAGLAAPRGGRRSGEPGHVTVQGRVTDEGTGVDERVRDDHRGHPPPPAVQHAEDDAQDRVAEE